MDTVEDMPGLVHLGNSMRDIDYVCFVTEDCSVRTLLGLKRVIAEPPALHCLLPNVSEDEQDMWRSFGDELQSFGGAHVFAVYPYSVQGL